MFSGCDKESLGVSSIISYPAVKVLGDQFMTVAAGSTYIDAGCLATEGTTDITSTAVTTGTVDTNTPGVYIITYSAQNVNGTASKSRYVGVIDATASAMDISGRYRRNAGALGYATITKTSYPGMYINNNPGGVDLNPAPPTVAPAPIPIYMFHWTATKIGAPAQSSSVGTFACTNGVYDSVNLLYKWVCVNSGYGTALRTFIKQ